MKESSIGRTCPLACDARRAN